MTDKKKKTSEHLSIVNGIRSESRRTEAEKIAGKRKRATNDCAESPFSMVKETKRVCGTNMSIAKCGGAAIIKGNGSVKRTLTSNGMEYGWLHRQPEWVQECIIIHSEEQARKEEEKHRRALSTYGHHRLKIFQEEVKQQRAVEWGKYNGCTKYHGMLFTSECFRTVQDLEVALANCTTKKAKMAIVKDNFNIWEQGAGWNRLFTPSSEEYIRMTEPFKDLTLTARL